MVLAEAHLVGVTRLHQCDDEVGLPVVGHEHLDADAVEAHERAPLGDGDVAGRVGRLTLMADQAAAEVDAVLRQDVLLHVAANGVLTVADDGQARLRRSHRGGRDHLAVVLPGGIGRGDLDRARLDPGGADPVVDLVEIELGDLFGRAHPPVVRDADVLVIEARRTDDLHAGALRNLGHQLGVAAEVDRTRIDERTHPVLGQAGHALDRRLHARGPVPSAGRVEVVTRVADPDVLVDERRPEVGRRPPDR